MLSCDLVKKQGTSAFLQSQPPFHPLQHPRPPQGQAASGSGFSTALQGSRKHKDGPLMTMKDNELSNFLEVFILLNTLCDFQNISGTKTGWVVHIFHYFSPWKKRLTAFTGEETWVSPRWWPPCLGTLYKAGEVGKERGVHTWQMKAWCLLCVDLINKYIAWHWQLLGVNGNSSPTELDDRGGIQVPKRKRPSLQLTLNHCKRITTLDAQTPWCFEADFRV